MHGANCSVFVDNPPSASSGQLACCTQGPHPGLHQCLLLEGTERILSKDTCFWLRWRGEGVGGCGPESPREFCADAGRTCKDIKSGKLHTRRIQRENELHMKPNCKQATAETSDKTKCRSRTDVNSLADPFFFLMKSISWNKEIRQGPGHRPNRSGFSVASETLPKTCCKSSSSTPAGEEGNCTQGKLLPGEQTGGFTLFHNYGS